MSGGLSGIPEPVTPEHDLLRGAAPRVRLSAGLRQQVLATAAVQYQLGRRQRLLTRAGVIATVVLCVAGAIWRLSQPAAPVPAAAKTPVVIPVVPRAVPSTPSATLPSTSSGGSDIMPAPQGKMPAVESIQTVPLLRPL
jgi:hypothetical protein